MSVRKEKKGKARLECALSLIAVNLKLKFWCARANVSVLQEYKGVVQIV